MPRGIVTRIKDSSRTSQCTFAQQSSDARVTRNQRSSCGFNASKATLKSHNEVNKREATRSTSMGPIQVASSTIKTPSMSHIPHHSSAAGEKQKNQVKVVGFETPNITFRHAVGDSNDNNGPPIIRLLQSPSDEENALDDNTGVLMNQSTLTGGDDCEEYDSDSDDDLGK